LHQFKTYQDLPIKWAIAVEQFSINGSLFLAFANYKAGTGQFKTDSFIYKLNDSTAKFSPYQTIHTSGGRDIEYFTIADKHYLAVANPYNGKTSRVNSVIYQWNGKQFLVFQNISTIRVTSFNFFEIFGKPFLAVTNTGRANSTIYKWKDNHFEKFQEIETKKAEASTAFVINNITYVVFANNHSFQEGDSVKSSVFKWSGESFVEYQSLQTYGAWDVKSFNINGTKFLAFANTRKENNYSIESFIYKWNGSNFIFFQSIPTYGARAWHPFVMCGQTFLGVANQEGNSVVYQVSGEQIIKYQEIPTKKAFGMTSYEYKGHTYLAIASRNNNNGNANSALYKWGQN